MDTLHKGSRTLYHIKNATCHASSQVQTLLYLCMYVCMPARVDISSNLLLILVSTHTYTCMYSLIYFRQSPPGNSTVISGVNTTCYIV